MPSNINLNAAKIRIGEANELTQTQFAALENALRQLHPWRKGPYSIFGLDIDTEWRSDWKWDRLAGAIAPLSDRVVLDIGCGSSYHCWRMRGAGARFVLGIDPTLLFVMQYASLQHFIRDPSVQVLPLGIEDLPTEPACFDTVFSMGLLYHRRDPQEHLSRVMACLREGGQLVLETLVLDVQQEDILIPQDRYAQMRNVWAIPSVVTLIKWIRESGFSDVRCIDVSATSIREQRQTQWMQFKSLADFLDPADSSRTIEGYPAPVRAVCVATK